MRRVVSVRTDTAFYLLMYFTARQTRHGVHRRAAGEHLRVCVCVWWWWWWAAVVVVGV